MAKALERTEATVSRGDRVRVEEENLTPWEGDVGAVKWSNVSGWWVEVHKEGIGTYTMQEALLTKLERKE